MHTLTSIFTMAGVVAALATMHSSINTRVSGDQAGAATVPLQQYAGRLVTVSAGIGRETLRLLLDTGGGQTLVTPAIAAKIGCQPSGRSVGFRMSGERVEFASCPIDGLAISGRSIQMRSVAVWDVMSILPKELPPIDGVLALDAFASVPFTLQLAQRQLVLEDSASLARRITSMKPVPIRIATGISGADLTVFVRSTSPRSGWLLYDSANLADTVVAPHMVDDPAPRQTVPLHIEGLPERRVPIAVRQLIYDGALSEAFIRDWTWTFRLATAEAWASPVEPVVKQ